MILKVLPRAIRQEREVKEIQTGKGEVQVSLFADDGILHGREPKDSSTEILKLINIFHKVEDTKLT